MRSEEPAWIGMKEAKFKGLKKVFPGGEKPG